MPLFANSKLSPLRDQNDDEEENELMERLRKKNRVQKTAIESIKIFHGLSNKSTFDPQLLHKHLSSLRDSIKIRRHSYVVDSLEWLCLRVGVSFSFNHHTSEVLASSEIFTFRMSIGESGCIEDVTIIINNDSKSCPEILSKLQSYDYTELEKHICNLSIFNNISNDKKVKSRVVQALWSLETDLNALSAFQSSIPSMQSYVHRSPLGIVVPRLGGLPMKLTYFVGPYDLINKQQNSILPMSIEAIVEGDLGHSLTVEVEKSPNNNRLQLSSIMLTNKCSDGKSLPVFAHLNNTNSCLLPARFVAVLKTPLVLTWSLVNKIRQVTGINIAQPHNFRSLLPLLFSKYNNNNNNNSSTLNNNNINNYDNNKNRNNNDPNEGGLKKHNFFAVLKSKAGVEWLKSSVDDIIGLAGVEVTRIPFTHPTHVPNITCILRLQTLFNTLLSSCLSSKAVLSDVASEVLFEVLVLSLRQICVTMQHPFKSCLVNFDLELNDNISVTCQVKGLDPNDPDDNLYTLPNKTSNNNNNNPNSAALNKDFVNRVMQKCLSVPVMLRAVLRKLKINHSQKTIVKYNSNNNNNYNNNTNNFNNNNNNNSFINNNNNNVNDSDVGNMELQQRLNLFTVLRMPPKSLMKQHTVTKLKVKLKEALNFLHFIYFDGASNYYNDKNNNNNNDKKELTDGKSDKDRAKTKITKIIKQFERIGKTDFAMVLSQLLQQFINAQERAAASNVVAINNNNINNNNMINNNMNNNMLGNVNININDESKTLRLSLPKLPQGSYNYNNYNNNNNYNNFMNNNNNNNGMMLNEAREVSYDMVDNKVYYDRSNENVADMEVEVIERPTIQYKQQRPFQQQQQWNKNNMSYKNLNTKFQGNKLANMAYNDASQSSSMQQHKVEKMSSHPMLASLLDQSSSCANQPIIINSTKKRQRNQQNDWNAMAKMGKRPRGMDDYLQQMNRPANVRPSMEQQNSLNRPDNVSIGFNNNYNNWKGDNIMKKANYVRQNSASQLGKPSFSNVNSNNNSNVNNNSNEKCRKSPINVLNINNGNNSNNNNANINSNNNNNNDVSMKTNNAVSAPANMSTIQNNPFFINYDSNNNINNNQNNNNQNNNLQNIIQNNNLNNIQNTNQNNCNADNTMLASRAYKNNNNNIKQKQLMNNNNWVKKQPPIRVKLDKRSFISIPNNDNRNKNNNAELMQAGNNEDKNSTEMEKLKSCSLTDLLSESYTNEEQKLGKPALEKFKNKPPMQAFKRPKKSPEVKLKRSFSETNQNKTANVTEDNSMRLSKKQRIYEFDDDECVVMTSTPSPSLFTNKLPCKLKIAAKNRLSFGARPHLSLKNCKTHRLNKKVVATSSNKASSGGFDNNNFCNNNTSSTTPLSVNTSSNNVAAVAQHTQQTYMETEASSGVLDVKVLEGDNDNTSHLGEDNPPKNNNIISKFKLPQNHGNINATQSQNNNKATKQHNSTRPQNSMKQSQNSGKQSKSKSPALENKNGNKKGNLSAVIDNLMRKQASNDSRGSQKLYDAIRLEIIKEGNKPSNAGRDQSNKNINKNNNNNNNNHNKNKNNKGSVNSKTPSPKLLCPISTNNTSSNTSNNSGNSNLTETISRPIIVRSSSSSPINIQNRTSKAVHNNQLKSNDDVNNDDKKPNYSFNNSLKNQTQNEFLNNNINASVTITTTTHTNNSNISNNNNNNIYNLADKSDRHFLDVMTSKLNDKTSNNNNTNNNNDNEIKTSNNNSRNNPTNNYNNDPNSNIIVQRMISPPRSPSPTPPTHDTADRIPLDKPNYTLTAAGSSDALSQVKVVNIPSQLKDDDDDDDDDNNNVLIVEEEIQDDSVNLYNNVAGTSNNNNDDDYNITINKNNNNNNNNTNNNKNGSAATLQNKNLNETAVVSADVTNKAGMHGIDKADTIGDKGVSNSTTVTTVSNDNQFADKNANITIISDGNGEYKNDSSSKSNISNTKLNNNNNLDITPTKDSNSKSSINPIIITPSSTNEQSKPLSPKINQPTTVVTKIAFDETNDDGNVGCSGNGGGGKVNESGGSINGVSGANNASGGGNSCNLNNSDSVNSDTTTTTTINSNINNGNNGDKKEVPCIKVDDDELMDEALIM